jgi:hypothetical protein
LVEPRGRAVSAPIYFNFLGNICIATGI